MRIRKERTPQREAEQRPRLPQDAADQTKSPEPPPGARNLVIVILDSLRYDS